MNRTNKIFRHTARGLGILLVVLLIVVLLSPVLINMDPVKDKILTYLSEKTAGKLLYKKVDILYFPQPHAVIHQAIVSLPGNFKGKLARLNVYPAIFPLFTGDVRIKKLKIRTPNLELRLPLWENKRNEQTNVLLIQPVKKALIDSCKYFLANLSDTAIQIQNGSLTIYDETSSVFNFQNINAHTKISSKKIKIDLMGKSNLWENIAVNGWINPQIFTCKGQLSVTHFSPKKLTDFIFPDADWKIADGDINFDLDFQSDKPNLVLARVQCRKSHLTWLQGNDKLAIKAKRLLFKLDIDDERTKVYLSNLTLGYPNLSASGQLILNRMTDQISLDIDAKKLDVGSTRKVALTLAENKGITNDIFDIVRDGKIPEISFKSFGKSLADLGKLENIFLKGKLRDGNIFVPAALLDLKDVDGNVTLTNGILLGENITSRLGNSYGQNGILKLGFEKHIPFYVETNIQADLVQLPPILKRLVKYKPFLKELSQIKHVNGSALGKMVLDGSTQSVDVSVNASQINLRGRYGRIPYSLRINGGRFVYQDTQISFDNLNTLIGKSSFSQLSGGVTWKGEPQLKIKSNLAKLQMEEVYPWFLSYKNIATIFKDFKVVHGTTTLSGISLHGPVLRPMNWDIHMKGSVENILIKSTLSPDPISVAHGKFDIKESAIPGTGRNRVTIQSANLAWGSSLFNSEGSIIFYRERLWLYTELSTDQIGWDRVDQIIEYVNKKKDPGPDEKSWTLPVEGVFRIKSDYFTWGDLTFNPAYADIFVRDGKISIYFTKANLCGISVPGSIKISSTNMELILNPLAESQQLEQTVACHWRKNQLVTGKFNLSGNLFAVSTSKEIGKVLNGKLKFIAKDGRIYRYDTLAKIFALLNLSEIFRGKLPDMIEEGFAYNSIQAEGELENGKFIFKEFVIDGASMTTVCEGYIDLVRDEMDMVVLVAPFKTVDYIIKHIPLVNQILGGNLVSIPFRVKGNPADPDIIPLSPTAIGTGVLGIIKRTLKLPVTIFQPLVSGKNGKIMETPIEQIGP